VHIFLSAFPSLTSDKSKTFSFGGRTYKTDWENSANLYCPDSIPHLQRQALQYLASQYLHLGFTLGDMQITMRVAYSSFVTNVKLCMQGKGKGKVVLPGLN
jgi:hypothetical protein